MKRVLVDTGPLVAIISENDRHHDICTRQLRDLTPPLLTCWPVITEAAYLLRRDIIAVQRLLEGFEVGLLDLLPIERDAAPWISAFLQQYRDLAPQLADACLVWLAERENIDTIFTLDRRDFTAFRLGSGRGLNLLPVQL
ncbi:MAG: PIN domain-containing protein [Planctomycetales bacterium]